MKPKQIIFILVATFLFYCLLNNNTYNEYFIEKFQSQHTKEVQPVKSSELVDNSNNLDFEQGIANKEQHIPIANINLCKKDNIEIIEEQQVHEELVNDEEVQLKDKPEDKLEDKLEDKPEDKLEDKPKVNKNILDQEFNPDHNPNLNREPSIESCQKNCKYFKYDVDYYQLVNFDNLLNKNSCGLKKQTQCGLSNDILQELK